MNEEASTTSAAAEHSGGPPSKRQKTLVACASCKRGKSRCEPAAEGGGCHRCVALGRQCSFLDGPPPGYQAQQTYTAPAPTLVPIANTSHAAPVPAPASASTLLDTLDPSSQSESLLMLPDEVVDSLQRLIAETLTRRIVQADQQPLFVLSEVAVARQKSKQNMLSLRALDHCIDMLSLVGLPTENLQDAFQPDLRWIIRPADLPTELASICAAQDAATWTQPLHIAKDLFILAEGPTVIKLRLKRAEVDETRAPLSHRTLLASLLITEASLAIYSEVDFPPALSDRIRSLLLGLDELGDSHQTLALHADLLVALEACRSVAQRQFAAEDLFKDLEAIRNGVSKVDAAHSAVHMAYACCERDSSPYYYGLLIQASIYRVLSRVQGVGFVMRAMAKCDGEARKSLHDNDFRRFGEPFGSLLLDVLSGFITMATVWADHLATAPDLLFVGLACTVEYVVRVEMTIREWHGASSAQWSNKARLLRKVAALLAPADATSPLHGRQLSLRVGRLCAALAQVVSNASMPILSLDDLLGVGWENI